ncbi:MAG: bifunctional glutamate N-acetyltransferase/amino-acid acetyltransferase ArgJ [Pirellulales bacterium]
MNNQLPQGYRAAGVHCGIKEDPDKRDLSLLVSEVPAVAVGVYTQNLVCAAPVKLCQQRTPSDTVRAVVINSGVANACTGEQGHRDADQMSQLVAQFCRQHSQADTGNSDTGNSDTVDAQQVLVLSTGVIGQLLPMDNIKSGIDAAVRQLNNQQSALLDAARGMMTTDTREKIVSRHFLADDVPIRITGLAKGAAMIGPNLATMLAVIMTDAALDVHAAQAGLIDAADESFNCISVEGHTSTNDTVLLLANGAAGGQVLSGQSLAAFQATLVEVCEDLAQSIPADGEGASHLITVEVHGCRTRADAVKIARTIADSPLVKTAIAGADPNWGRIVSAAGYAGVAFDEQNVSLHINRYLLYERGVPMTFDEKKVSTSIRNDRNTSLVLLLDEGTASARFWTTDLTTEYVRLNAEYRT